MNLLLIIVLFWLVTRPRSPSNGSGCLIVLLLLLFAVFVLLQIVGTAFFVLMHPFALTWH